MVINSGYNVSLRAACLLPLGRVMLAVSLCFQPVGKAKLSGFIFTAFDLSGIFSLGKKVKCFFFSLFSLV